MSNRDTELVSTTQIEHTQTSLPNSNTPTFDAFQLHMEGANKAPTTVAENNLTPAVLSAEQNGGQAHLEEAQYHPGGGGHGRDYGRGYDYGPGFAAGVAGALLYDGLVAPYAYNNYGPGYGYQTECQPQYYGPPQCFTVPVEPYVEPVVPLYGGRFYGPEPRYHEVPRYFPGRR